MEKLRRFVFGRKKTQKEITQPVEQPVENLSPKEKRIQEELQNCGQLCALYLIYPQTSLLKAVTFIDLGQAIRQAKKAGASEDQIKDTLDEVRRKYPNGRSLLE